MCYLEDLAPGHGDKVHDRRNSDRFLAMWPLGAYNIAIWLNERIHMPTLKVHAVGTKAKTIKRCPGAGVLGINTNDSRRIVQMVRAGFPFSRLARFQRVTELPWEKVARIVAIRRRTLTRRQGEGRLQPDESDRVWRASAIFDMAVDLFEGDAGAAAKWLQTPQPGLGGEIPLDLASTGVGAREIENLIGRLEYGVVV